MGKTDYWAQNNQSTSTLPIHTCFPFTPLPNAPFSFLKALVRWTSIFTPSLSSLDLPLPLAPFISALDILNFFVKLHYLFSPCVRITLEHSSFYIYPYLSLISRFLILSLTFTTTTLLKHPILSTSSLLSLVFSTNVSELNNTVEANIPFSIPTL